MVYHYTYGREYGVIFGNQHDTDFPLWTYVITVVFGLIMCAFLFIGKIDTVLIDKRMGYICKSRITLFCIIRRSERQTDDLTGLAAYKKGNKGMSVDNLFYQIKASFRC